MAYFTLHQPPTPFLPINNDKSLITAQILKENWLKTTGFAHSQTRNKLVNEAANDYARVSEEDRKKPLALGTNQIAVFGGFRPPTSLEQNKKHYRII